ncbi:MAG: hypothetical protein JWN48_2534 [Myxococcaceae bacterium]|nr:hypothetical protein [Myxococcaceae bacterium]
MTLTRRALLAGIAGAALGSTLGCSDRSAKAASSSNGRKKVRLTYGNVQVHKPRGVLEKTLREQGIDVEWLGPFPNHAPTLQAVATDTADFSLGGSSTPAAQALLSGSKLTYVAWSEYTPRNTSIIVLPNSGIESVQGLVGKTVAVNKAGVAEFLLVAALEKYKVPRDQVQISYLNPPDAAGAFAAGKVDAWAIWTGPLEMAEVTYGARRIFVEGKELDYQIDFGSYLVRDEYAQREPDTIRKVISAMQADYRWANENHKEAFEMTYKQAKYPPAVVERLLQARLTQNIHFMDEVGIKKLQFGADWAAEHKVISGKLDIAEHSLRA